jgi:cytochrome b subunit of formate dehydrogenase
VDWTAFNAVGEKIEMWTTIVVNMTAIITGLVVAVQWIVRRVEPTVRNVSRTAIYSLLLNLIGALVSVFAAELFGTIYRTLFK